MADTTFYSRDYLSRSWKMMTQDKGWWKPVLILALVGIVPIIGAITLMGYAFEWARLTAWGVDSAPKQKGVKVGGVLKSGWRVFVVQLGLGIVLALIDAIVTAILSAVFGYGILSMLVSLVSIAIALAGSMFILVASLRATIYQKIGPGYGIGHIWEMCRRDYKGLGRILVINLLGGVVSAALSFIVFALSLSWLVPVIVAIASAGYYGYGMYGYGIADALGTILAAAGPMAIVISYLYSVITTVFTLLVANALGLWVRQFNVPAWTDSHDDLPDPVPSTPVLPSTPAPSPVNPQAAPVSQQPDPVVYPNEDVTAGKVEDMNVTPPSDKDLYVDAADAITEWTSVVEPEDHATDHMDYKDEPTEKPVEQGEPASAPTHEELYMEAGREVAAWPEVDLESTNALEAKAEAEKMEGAKNQVFDDPITVPSHKDMYEGAADALTEWTSVVEPDTDATSHLAYKPQPTKAPVEQGEPAYAPTNEEIYGEADVKVAEWPENALDDSAVVAHDQLIEDDLKMDDPTTPEK